MGREIAIQLSELGAIVLCVDKNSANNKNTLDAIKMRDGTALSFTCDITKKANVEELAKQVKKVRCINLNTLPVRDHPTLLPLAGTKYSRKYLAPYFKTISVM